MKIIGIDPGFDRNGIAVIDRNGSKDALLFSMLVQTDKKQEMSERLAVVAVEIERILFEYKPDLLIMEQLFMSKNVTTVIGVAEARGVILAAAGKLGIPTREIGPMQVKLAITGYGKAEKSAVAMMVGKLITLPDRKMVDDEMDAIAIALAGSAVFGHQYASRK
ncbi:MAG: crossover junction endodeoxyribonuclease RuvC [Candidatus Pacebacteria bacterium]|jgi:crossover junction endodeoxyribonuclease RuvC|nr:crossover junction endodeoxyribonuclease RuvC [Candidatus Paceibacterota bacterium]